MISVCIATYNGAGWILEQLDSIIPQLSEGDEIVVSDDGSTDDTLARIRSLNNPLIRIVDGPVSRSPIYNFENALRHAKGDIIFLADQDDRWVDNKVEVMLKALEKYDCVVSDCYVTNSKMEITYNSFYAVNKTHRGRLYNLLCKNGYLGCCMAFNRKVLERVLPFPPNLPMHDIWIGNIAAYYFSVCFIPEPLIYYRRHGHTTSVSGSKSTYSLLQKLKFRINVIPPLLAARYRKKR